MPNRYYTRRFLNRRGHHAGAYVLASVEDTSRRPDDTTWTDVDFVLSDCGRQIQLDFDVDTDSLANSLHKVDVLLETLTKFRAALVEEGRLAAERDRRVRAAKAEAAGVGVPRHPGQAR
ncbi:hypothetical protein GCM10022197_18370 [Microlunatus spumicola]|uniref:Uncharacterized protein n=1 Tax=Microlunatus spumicola TaxID=81499 RepID=A0ABP6X8G0_9ACTN